MRFGRGRYALSTVFLKSNVTIEVPTGTEIVGAESYYDYAQEEKVDYPIYQDSSHTYFHPSLFVGIDCENIKITGGGKIEIRFEMKEWIKVYFPVKGRVKFNAITGDMIDAKTQEGDFFITFSELFATLTYVFELCANVVSIF